MLTIGNDIKTRGLRAVISEYEADAKADNDMDLLEAKTDAVVSEMSADKKIAFMDFTGSSHIFKDVYKQCLAEDGFEGEVYTIEDTKMTALCAAVNSGAEVVLYTCDDDYKYNCPSIAEKPNFKVRLVGKN